jgi:hypothetical protein
MELFSPMAVGVWTVAKLAGVGCLRNEVSFKVSLVIPNYEVKPRTELGLSKRGRLYPDLGPVTLTESRLTLDTRLYPSHIEPVLLRLSVS